jgi:hypothetical protein
MCTALIQDNFTDQQQALHHFKKVSTKNLNKFSECIISFTEVQKHFTRPQEWNKYWLLLLQLIITQCSIPISFCLIVIIVLWLMIARMFYYTITCFVSTHSMTDWWSNGIYVCKYLRMYICNYIQKAETF